jgi:hypothetical protein
MSRVEPPEEVTVVAALLAFEILPAASLAHPYSTFDPAVPKA